MSAPELLEFFAAKVTKDKPVTLAVADEEENGAWDAFILSLFLLCCPNPSGSHRQDSHQAGNECVCMYVYA